MGEVNWINLAITVAVGLIIWFIPAPEGLTVTVWHLFAIFVATIVGLIIKPMPMGAIAIMAIAVCILTGSVGTIKDGKFTASVAAGLAGFSDTTIWLIVIAFFISRGFIKTGLGSRVAYLFVKAFGKKTLGLSYALAATDLVLAPAMPSIPPVPAASCGLSSSLCAERSSRILKTVRRNASANSCTCPRSTLI